LDTRGCLHSAGSQDGGDEVDHCRVACVGLLIPRGNASKRFEAAEEVFDEVTPLVFLAIMLPISGRSSTQWNDGLNVAALQLRAQPLGVECLVADQGETGDAGQQNVKGGDVVALTRQQHEADQVTERIDEDRNLGGQTAA
jgi:hypothetical protein